MSTKRTALAVAATGVVAGAVGLGVLAMPAGANEAPPALPTTSAEELVQSVVTSKVPAMDGKVEATENLGLPVPLLPEGVSGGSVSTDGQGRFKATLPGQRSETTIVEDGGTLWTWNSADRSVTKVPHQGKEATHERPDTDPATLAKDVVAMARQYSDVQVDGTAMVADRPAYQLVLTPKPTERTLLREVRVAVDSETRIPLRLEVLANGQAEPALKVGFTEFNVRAQDPGQFTFTPPEGAKVTERKPDEGKPGNGGPAADKEQLFGQLAPQIVGEGWDTVAVVKLPAEAAGMLGTGGPAKSGSAPEANGKTNQDTLELLRQFGKEIDVAGGKAWVFNTKVGTALVTADGRAAVGAVPQQVLVEAIGQVK